MVLRAARYEREVVCCHRSPVRKVLQRDASPAAHMVLCVAQLTGTSTNTHMVVTDGWYRVAACCDSYLQSHIQSGRLRVGHKIRVLGAEVLPPRPRPRPGMVLCWCDGAVAWCSWWERKKAWSLWRSRGMLPWCYM